MELKVLILRLVVDMGWGYFLWEMERLEGTPESLPETPG